jgi:hypothetical protein
MHSEQKTGQVDRNLAEHLNCARYASLTSRAVTDAARDVVDRRIEFLEGREEYRKARKNRRSKTAQHGIRRAMEGFVGDLLRAYQDEKSGGWVYRSKKSGSFTGERVSYREFCAVLDSLVGSVETRTGYQPWSDGFDPGGPRLPLRGKATRYRATPSLIEWCSELGVDVSDINNHFIQDLPRHPLVLRTGSVRDRYGAKVRGRPMKFERTRKALELEEQVRDLNNFLDGFDLRGGAHRGYVRNLQPRRPSVLRLEQRWPDVQPG